MIFNKTDIEGLVLIETKKFHDSRGHFFESYQQERFRNFIRDKSVQHIKDIETLLVYTMDEVDKIKKRHMSKNVIISEPDWLRSLRPIKSI